MEGARVYAQITLPLEEDAEIILTVAQVARKLNVSENTVTVWIKSGDFPNAFKQNPRLKQSRWRIPQRDLDAFIEKRIQQRGYCYRVN